MKISCLIAAYRAGNYIGKALESIAAQDFPAGEVIVVEDGSHDQTESIVAAFSKTFGPPVRYHNLSTNQGVATARNRLLELAGGNPVAFLDADDWWTPGHLRQAAELLDQRNDLVVSPIQLFDLDAQRLLEVYRPPEMLFSSPVTTLFDQSAIMTSSSVTLSSGIIQRTGFFDPSFRIGEDRDYWLRCASAGATFALSPEITCFYSKHAGSTMARTLLWSQQEVAFYEKHSDLSMIDLKKRRRKLSASLLNYGKLLRASDRVASRAILRRSFYLSPSLLTLLHWLR